MMVNDEWIDTIETLKYLGRGQGGISISTLYRRINDENNPLPAGTRMGNGQRVYWNTNELDAQVERALNDKSIEGNDK